MGILKLPMRRGPRPRTAIGILHPQLDQPGPPEIIAQLRDICFSLPGVEQQASRICVPGTRALCLQDGIQCGAAVAFLTKREFAHLHPPLDGSLHARLPPDVFAFAIERGWAEPHVLSRELTSPTVAMIFAPRNSAELMVVIKLVEESRRFATRFSRGD
jgi:hypothetical protein